MISQFNFDNSWLDVTAIKLGISQSNKIKE